MASLPSPTHLSLAPPARSSSVFTVPSVVPSSSSTPITGIEPNCTAVQNGPASAIITINYSNKCVWNNSTLAGILSVFDNSKTLVNISNLAIEGGGVVNVTGPWNITIEGELSVENASTLSFNRSDHLVLGARSFSGIVVDSGSRLLLNSIPISMSVGSGSVSGGYTGGYITINNGTLYGGSHALAKTSPPTVTEVAIQGPGKLKSISVTGSAVSYLNVSVNVSSVTLIGTFSKPARVDNLNASYSSIENLRADNVILTNTSIGHVTNLTVGNGSTPSPDYGFVYNLFVSGVVSATAQFSHTTLSRLSWSGATDVLLTNSTVLNGSARITDASSSFVATGGCLFKFPLVFNGTSQVRLVNVTAPSLVFNGATAASIYNWRENTSVVSGSVANLPGITVKNQSASVLVYRFVTVLVRGQGGAVVPPGSRLTITDTLVPASPTYDYSLPNSGTLYLYLLTDNVSVGGDSFVGSYEFTASTSSGTVSSSVTLTTEMQVILQVPSPPAILPFNDQDIFLSETAALAATLLGVAYLTLRNRRMSRSAKAEPSEEKPMPPSP